MGQDTSREKFGLGWSRVHLAPGMAPTARSGSSNLLSELEFRCGIVLDPFEVQMADGPERHIIGRLVSARSRCFKACSSCSGCDG